LDKPITPRGINHLVLNVRDLEESHRFWTEIVGFKQVGELQATPERPNPPRMRFYSGVHDGRMQHHALAPPAPPMLPGGREPARRPPPPSPCRAARPGLPS